jgi:hypothetical protein
MYKAKQPLIDECIDKRLLIYYFPVMDRLLEITLFFPVFHGCF